MNLLNPTSGKDAFHPCLISVKPKEGCTTTTHESFPNQVFFALEMGRGVDATLTNLLNPTLGRDAFLRLNAYKAKGWEAFLPDVRLSKFVRVVSAPRLIPVRDLRGNPHLSRDWTVEADATRVHYVQAYGNF